MLDIKYKQFNKSSIEYIGNTNLNVRDFKKTMEDICEEDNVSIFWQLKRNGEFFISLDFCPAKVCMGNLID